MTPKEIAENAERMALAPNEHSLADAFRLIADFANAMPKRGRPPKDQMNG